MLLILNFKFSFNIIFENSDGIQHCTFNHLLFAPLLCASTDFLWLAYRNRNINTVIFRYIEAGYSEIPAYSEM